MNVRSLNECLETYLKEDQDTTINNIPTLEEDVWSRSFEEDWDETDESTTTTTTTNPVNDQAVIDFFESATDCGNIIDTSSKIEYDEYLGNKYRVFIVKVDSYSPNFKDELYRFCKDNYWAYYKDGNSTFFIYPYNDDMYDTLNEGKFSDMINKGLSHFGKGMAYQVIDDKFGRIKSFNTEAEADEFAKQYSKEHPASHISIGTVNRTQSKNVRQQNKEAEQAYAKRMPEPQRFNTKTGEETPAHQAWEIAKPERKLAKRTIKSTYQGGDKLGAPYFEIVDEEGNVLHKCNNEREAYIWAHDYTTMGIYKQISIKYPERLGKSNEALIESDGALTEAAFWQQMRTKLDNNKIDTILRDVDGSLRGAAADLGYGVRSYRKKYRDNWISALYIIFPYIDDLDDSNDYDTIFDKLSDPATVKEIKRNLKPTLLELKTAHPEISSVGFVNGNYNGDIMAYINLPYENFLITSDTKLDDVVNDHSSRRHRDIATDLDNDFTDESDDWEPHFWEQNGI